MGLLFSFLKEPFTATTPPTLLPKLLDQTPLLITDVLRNINLNGDVVISPLLGVSEARCAFTFDAHYLIWLGSGGHFYFDFTVYDGDLRGEGGGEACVRIRFK